MTRKSRNTPSKNYFRKLPRWVREAVRKERREDTLRNRYWERSTKPGGPATPEGLERCRTSAMTTGIDSRIVGELKKLDRRYREHPDEDGLLDRLEDLRMRVCQFVLDRVDPGDPMAMIQASVFIQKQTRKSLRITLGAFKRSLRDTGV